MVGIRQLGDRRLPGSGIIQDDRPREPSLPRLAHRSDLSPFRRRDPRPRPLPRHPHAVQPDLLLGQLPIVRPPASPGRRRALAPPLRRGDRRPAAGTPSSLRLGLARGPPPPPPARRRRPPPPPAGAPPPRGAGPRRGPPRPRPPFPGPPPPPPPPARP